MPDAFLPVYRRASPRKGDKRLKALLQNVRNDAFPIPDSPFSALNHHARPPNSPVTVLT